MRASFPNAIPLVTLTLGCLIVSTPHAVWTQEAPTPPKAGAALGAQQREEYFLKLVESLRSSSSFKVRLQAAVFLGHSEDERAFEPLIAALSSDEDYTVRAAAATALANLQDPRAISHIIKRVATDPDPFVRDEARRALEKYDEEEALPYVVATYGSDSREVRKQAVFFLAESSDAAAQQILIRALGDEEEIFEVAKKATLEMDGTDALGFLKNALDHRDAGVRRGAVRVLHEMGTAEAAQLILTVYERDIEADGVRSETRRALRNLRRFLDIDAIVNNAQSHPQKHTRAKAIKLLGVLGGEGAEKVLVTTLSDPDPYMRGNAVMALGDLGDPKVVPQLEKLAADPANQRIVHLVTHTIKQLNRQAAP